MQLNENAEKLTDCLIILKKFNESFKEVLTSQYGEETAEAVSYTHLTLPTILLV